MRLNEFANPRDYTLSTAGMAKLLKCLKSVWRGVGIDAMTPFVLRQTDEPKDVRQLLVDHGR